MSMLEAQPQPKVVGFDPETALPIGILRFDQDLRSQPAIYALAAGFLTNHFAKQAGYSTTGENTPSTTTELDGAVSEAATIIRAHLDERLDRHYEYDTATEAAISANGLTETIRARQNMRKRTTRPAKKNSSGEVPSDPVAENLRDAARSHRIALYAARVAAHEVEFAANVKPHDLPHTA